MRVNELVAAPPPPSLSPLHARRGSSGRAAGRRYVYDTKGERGTSAIAMTITVSVALVAWRAMNNLGAICADAAAPHAGRDNVWKEEQRRESEKEEEKTKTPTRAATNQIADFG